MNLTPGKDLLHYRLQEQIGAGGMGVVYRASDTKLRRDVAIKVLPDDFANDRERLARFKREARVLASLNHSGIASIHGFEESDGVHFLVLELVHGQDLAEIIAEGRISVPDAITYASQIAEGLESAHEKGIVHRDLKPANIKLAPDGTIKILDFGLASVFEPDPAPEDLHESPTITVEFTAKGTILGTAAYMSPEQVRGQPLDARTDIWALGCVLYEMLTGSGPFKRDTTTEMAAAILERDPDWDAVPTTLSPGVVRVLRRCLTKDPKQRFHSVADVRIELNEALDQSDPVLQTTGAPWLQRGVIALTGVLLGVVLMTMVMPGSKEATPPPTARLMIPVPKETPVIPTPECSAVAISPNGDFLVYVAAADPSLSPGTASGAAPLSQTQLYMRPLNSYRAIPIDGSIGATAPFISPDGEWIGYLNANTGQLMQVSRSGGAPVKVSETRTLDYRGTSWSDDGKLYFSVDGGVFEQSGVGKPYRSISKPDLEGGIKTHRFPHALPDSRGVLFTLGAADILSYDDAAVALLIPSTGEVRILVEGGTNPHYVHSGHIVFGRGGKILAVPFDLESLQVRGSPREMIDGVVTSHGYGSAHFSVSDHGTLVYVSGSPEQFSSELFILDRDGNVEPLPQPPREYGDVEVSPDGTRLVLSVLGANASVWVYELSRGTMTRLVSTWDNYTPTWNPQGDLISFGSNPSRTRGCVGQGCGWIW